MSRGIAPLTLNLDTRWRCMANFTPRLLYPRERIMVPTEQKLVWDSEPGGTGTRTVRPVAVTAIPAPMAVQRKSGNVKRAMLKYEVCQSVNVICVLSWQHTPLRPKPTISSSHYHPTRPFISTSIRHTARTERFTYIYLQTLAHTKFLNTPSVLHPNIIQRKPGPVIFFKLRR